MYIHTRYMFKFLEEMLEWSSGPAPPPSLEEFLSCFKLVATKEIETVYNMNKEYRRDGNEKTCFKTSWQKKFLLNTEHFGDIQRSSHEFDCFFVIY